MRFSGGSQFPAYLPEGMARCRGGSSFRFENLLAYGGCVAIESYVHNVIRHTGSAGVFPLTGAAVGWTFVFSRLLIRKMGNGE